MWRSSRGPLRALPKKAYAIPSSGRNRAWRADQAAAIHRKKEAARLFKGDLLFHRHHPAQELCSRAGLDPEAAPRRLDHEEANRLLPPSSRSRVKSPPVDCLSPIGEELIKAGLEKEFRLDFIATTVRPVSVYSGNPFLVEVGLGYGGELEKESRVEILRFANRVPLVYQQGACAITHAVESVSWKNYSSGPAQREAACPSARQCCWFISPPPIFPSHRRAKMPWPICRRF